jgi:hypothetical protein
MFAEAFPEATGNRGQQNLADRMPSIPRGCVELTNHTGQPLLLKAEQVSVVSMPAGVQYARGEVKPGVNCLVHMKDGACYGLVESYSAVVGALALAGER